MILYTRQNIPQGRNSGIDSDADNQEATYLDKHCQRHNGPRVLSL